MEKRVFTVLEFNKILTRLEEFAASEVGKDCVRALRPSQNLDEAQAYLKQTLEAEGLLIRGGQNPVEPFEDVRSMLKRMHAAFFLSMRELLALAQCFRASRLAKEKLTQEEAAGLLKHMAAQLAARRGVEEEIMRCILSEDEMADNASPALADTRRQMRIMNERARDKLNTMVKSSTFQKYLQEPIITIRNGRFVLPVKQEYRLQIPGLIHDQSGSGATLFIEPMAVVELGNEFKRLEGLEQEEVERILAGLTSLAEPYADELYESIGILGELDCIFAKGMLARDMRASCPAIGKDLPIRIKAGRHPLIASDRVVPVDVWLGDQFQTLIITGPNTGGKTVTLKTIGLFCLMAQAGLFIPALEGSTLRFFESIYADIGDEQSIEQSLSTFSSHMSNIVHIITAADSHSLILLDELGAGTDPVEGAALAMGILETLHEKGCLTAATTHYSEIKAFAMLRTGMENASMEFDVDKLSPTYRLFVGIPGKSNAFEIAQRLGLEEYIIERARSFLKKEDVQFEDVIQHAQTQKQRAEEERQQAQEHRYEVERLRQKTEEEKKRLETERLALRQKAREEARAIVRESKDDMDRIIAELRKLKNIDTKQLERAIQSARDAARKREETLLDPLAEQDWQGNAPASVRVGDRVRVLSLGQKATVLKAANANSEVQVQAGVIKLMAKLSDLRLLEETEKPQQSSVQYRPQAPHAIGLSVDIRGKLVDEALVEVDRYLDDASMHGIGEVQIIHGKGTGALRTGVQGYLRKHPKVKTYRLGNYGEGDAGVTVVTLK